ncbi:MAG TPA: hypothetical protein K8V47_10245, partial [Candidatus Amulumruptor caecigallinarius]|nr:hypothetical protein [Candidatus Amulumruptor caecigallinarius]
IFALYPDFNLLRILNSGQNPNFQNYPPNIQFSWPVRYEVLQHPPLTAPAGLEMVGGGACPE